MHFRHRQEAFKTFTRIPIFLSLCYRLKFLYPKYFAPSSQSHSRISLKIFFLPKKYIYPGAQNFRLSKYFSFQNILHQVYRAQENSSQNIFLTKIFCTRFPEPRQDLSQNIFLSKKIFFLRERIPRAQFHPTQILNKTVYKPQFTTYFFSTIPL